MKNRVLIPSAAPLESSAVAQAHLHLEKSTPLLILLASPNKWRYAPALAMPRMASAFQRAVAAEYLQICAVLVATAIMTTFFSPES